MGLVAPEARGILVPQPGMEPVSLALQGRFLTTELLGKSHSYTLKKNWYKTRQQKVQKELTSFAWAWPSLKSVYWIWAWCQFSHERCSAGSQLSCRQIPSRFRLHGVRAMGSQLLAGWMGEWVKEQLPKGAGEYHLDRLGVQIQCQGTSCYTGYFFWHGRLCLRGKILLLPSSVDISHQLHAVTTVVF